MPILFERENAPALWDLLKNAAASVLEPFGTSESQVVGAPDQLRDSIRDFVRTCELVVGYEPAIVAGQLRDGSWSIDISARESADPERLRPLVQQAAEAFERENPELQLEFLLESRDAFEDPPEPAFSLDTDRDLDESFLQALDEVGHAVDALFPDQEPDISVRESSKDVWDVHVTVGDGEPNRALENKLAGLQKELRAEFESVDLNLHLNGRYVGVPLGLAQTL